MEESSHGLNLGAILAFTWMDDRNLQSGEPISNQDSNMRPPKYKARVLTTWPYCSIKKNIF
jgi:hypothetical protein